MEESSLNRAPSRGGVSFLNVARTYIPNTKVECHYTLPPGTMPSASDWIGIFKVEAACVRDYHTFVWSSVPETTMDGSPTHASVQFQGIEKDGGPKQVVVGGWCWAKDHKK